jgi:hypothetical protein
MSIALKPLVVVHNEQIKDGGQLIDVVTRAFDAQRDTGDGYVTGYSRPQMIEGLSKIVLGENASVRGMNAGFLRARCRVAIAVLTEIADRITEGE